MQVQINVPVGCVNIENSNILRNENNWSHFEDGAGSQTRTLQINQKIVELQEALASYRKIDGN